MQRAVMHRDETVSCKNHGGTDFAAYGMRLPGRRMAVSCGGRATGTGVHVAEAFGFCDAAILILLGGACGDKFWFC
jgi:hypothetical protein